MLLAGRVKDHCERCDQMCRILVENVGNLVQERSED